MLVGDWETGGDGSGCTVVYAVEVCVAVGCSEIVRGADWVHDTFSSEECAVDAPSVKFNQFHGVTGKLGP